MADLSPVSSAVRKPLTRGSSHVAAIFSRNALDTRWGSQRRAFSVPASTVTASRLYSRAYTPRALKWVTSLSWMRAADCHRAVPVTVLPGRSVSSSSSP